ncbi:ABC transporter ATP-binding protein [Pelagibacterium lacus]|uniref:ABC transporter ATP-binding protein n=1 Tax=Pelagibacterium lacus TaxID=2282655 RepID=A0A369W2Y0_9HYPH|nr:ABC transporter ATP-binding protein [Pelagibacterium lacus]RDE08225.1 ABC transporter ATP-binding protein [Pelagibacterium lacus]
MTAKGARGHGEVIISFENLSLSFGSKLILDNINLDVARGEFLCVIGPSGCGKTTMLRLLAGLLTPSAGQILYQGLPVSGPRPDVAVLFQDYVKALLPWRTVFGNVSLALEAAQVPRKLRRDKIMAHLELVGLADHAEKYPTQLSGGMQQRLQIARCLAQDPEVLLMDEPFGALDAMTRQALQDEMQELASVSGCTIFFVTHDLEEAVYLGDRVIGLLPHPGRVGREFEVNISRPRDQLTTPEKPEFLQLRHELYSFIKLVEHG